MGTPQSFPSPPTPHLSLFPEGIALGALQLQCRVGLAVVGSLGSTGRQGGTPRTLHHPLPKDTREGRASTHRPPGALPIPAGTSRPPLTTSSGVSWGVLLGGRGAGGSSCASTRRSPSSVTSSERRALITAVASCHRDGTGWDRATPPTAHLPRVDPHSPGNLGTTPTCQMWDWIQMWGGIQIPGPDRSPEAVPVDGEGRTPPRQDGMGGGRDPNHSSGTAAKTGSTGKAAAESAAPGMRPGTGKGRGGGMGGQGGQKWGTWWGGDPDTSPPAPPEGSVPPTHPEEAPDGRQVPGTRRPLRFRHLFPHLAPHPLLSSGRSHPGVPPSCPPALTQLIRTILGVPEPGSGTRHSPYMTLPTENFPASSSGPPAVRRGCQRGYEGTRRTPPQYSPAAPLPVPPESRSLRSWCFS